jgi:hypothetical protein
LCYIKEQTPEAVQSRNAQRDTTQSKATLYH